MAKKAKSQLYRSLADAMAEMMKQTTKQADAPQTSVSITKVKRPRIIKPTTQGAEKIYTGITPTVDPVEIEKSTVVAETLKDLRSSLDHMEQIDGKRVPAWQESIMKRTIKQDPSAFNRTATPVNPTYPKYTSNDFGVKDYFTPQDYLELKGVTTVNTTPVGWTPDYTTSSIVSNIPDYFKPQQYRGIDNIDTMFEQAESMSALGANNAAKQFASAGLEDVAAIAKGKKPTSFKYKPSHTVVPKSVVEEIAERRNAPAGTAEWLHNISVKNPDLGTSYLDLFAKRLEYFKKMFNADGTAIK